ncbi:MAG TPA: hypothetical protein ENN43_04160 [bacterium]|nr:hypothetical protein [bacterium]
MLRTGFIGEYEHSLDDKDRVSIPSKYKKYVEDIADKPEARELLILAKAPGKKRCIEAIPVQDWERLAEDYRKSVTLKDETGEADDKIWQKSRRAFEAVIDRTGRIRIPSKLKEYAGIGKKVIFIGAIDRFQIWGEAELKKFDSGI